MCACVCFKWGREITNETSSKCEMEIKITSQGCRYKQLPYGCGQAKHVRCIPLVQTLFGWNCPHYVSWEFHIHLPWNHTFKGKLADLQEDFETCLVQCPGNNCRVPTHYVPTNGVARHALWLRTTLIPKGDLGYLYLRGYRGDWILLLTQVCNERVIRWCVEGWSDVWVEMGWWVGGDTVGRVH